MCGPFVSTGFCHVPYLTPDFRGDLFSCVPPCYATVIWASPSLWFLESAKPSGRPSSGKGPFSPSTALIPELPTLSLLAPGAYYNNYKVTPVRWEAPLGLLPPPLLLGKGRLSSVICNISL